MNQEDKDQIVVQLRKLEKEANEKYSESPEDSPRETRWAALDIAYGELAKIFESLPTE